MPEGSDEGNQFDVVILGAGSGGYACALRAAQLGLSVALVEKDKVGGTCLHVGCIPTKALLHAAEVADAARESEKFGVQATLDGIDMAGVNSYKDGVVSRLYKGLTGLVKGRGITVVEGSGRLTGPRTVEVDGTSYVGKAVVLASGSYSRTLPGLEIDGERVLTSEQALRLESVPRSVIVLGGGVIGCEFASVWRSFGAEVTIIEALPHLVPAEDEQSSKALERAFRKRKIAFATGTRFESVTTTDDGVTVTVEGGKTFEADLLLVAVGRGPTTDGLGYEEQGVAMERGFVTADERCRTNVDGRLRRRRHRARAPARAPRIPAGRLRGRGDRRPLPRRRSTRPASRASPTATRRSPPSGSPRPRRGSCTATPSRRSPTTSPATARARSWPPQGS